MPFGLKPNLRRSLAMGKSCPAAVLKINFVEHGVDWGISCLNRIYFNIDESRCALTRKILAYKCHCLIVHLEVKFTQ